MASRRQLKKDINYIVGDLFSETLVLSMLKPAVSQEKVDSLLREILELQSEFVRRISHTEPGNVKAYYKKLRTNFDEAVNNIFLKLKELDK